MILHKIQQMRPLVYLSLIIMSFTILSYGLMGATNAQTPESSVPPLSVETELALYSPGSTVVISGLVKTLNENYEQPVLIRIVDPGNSIVTIQQIFVNSDGTYSFSVVAGGTWKTAGEYTIFVNYGAQKIEATFEFTGGEGYTPPPPPPPDTTQPPPPDTTPPPPPECGPDEELVNGVCMDKEPEEPSCGPGTHLETDNVYLTKQEEEDASLQLQHLGLSWHPKFKC